MQIDLGEKDIIYLLNSLNITMRLLMYHNVDYYEYFNKSNYNEDFINLEHIHRRLSINANIFYYGLEENLFFRGQMEYLSTNEKDFNFLKYNKIKKEEKNNILKFTLDKLFKVV